MNFASERHAVADDISADPVVRREPMMHGNNPLAYNPGLSQQNPQVRRAPTASGLYDVLDLILDKGIVVDAFVRVSLVGIELLTIDLRVVIASVDTYLRYAEGAERLQLYKRNEAKSLPDMVDGAQEGMVGKGLKKAKDMITGSGEEEDDGGGKGVKGLVGGVRTAVRKILGGDEDEGNGSQRGERPQQQQMQRRDKGGSGDGASRQKAGMRRK